MAALIEEATCRALGTEKSVDLIVDRPAFTRRVPMVFVMPDEMPVPQFRLRGTEALIASRPTSPAAARFAGPGTHVDTRTSDVGYTMPRHADGGSALPDVNRVREALDGR